MEAARAREPRDRTDPAAGRSGAREVAWIAGLALVLRVAWVLVYGRVAPPDGGINDTVFYEYAAASLAHDGTYTSLSGLPTAQWPPGFPFVISVLYRVFGDHIKLVLALNVVVSTATVALVYLLAARVLGRRCARVAGIACAVLPGPLYMTGVVMTESLFSFLLVAIIAAFVVLPETRLKPFILGLAIGASALVRAEGLLIAVIPLAGWWRLPRRESAARAAVLLAVTALVLAPWVIRNERVMHAFIPGGTNAGATIWAGHNPTANGGPTYPPDELTARAADRPSHEVALGRLLRHEALSWAVRNPLKELGLIPRKLLALNSASSGSIGGLLNAGAPDQRQLGQSSVIVFTVLADAFGYALLVVTLAALVVLGPRRLAGVHPAMPGMLAYLALALVTYGFVTFGAWRYRIPMEPLMILLAAPLLVAFWDQRIALRETALRGARQPR